jgi:UDP-N-acetylglucosamine acyltransferase
MSISNLRTAYRFPGMMEVDGNLIHSSAAIGPDVRMGRGNVIAPFAVIVGNVTIGDENWIGPHVTIGTSAQYAGPRYELKEDGFLPIAIGSRNTFRECVTVHEPSKYTTIVEDDCYFMAYSHVSHDTVIRSKVTLSNSVQIGGFTEVQYGTVVGLSTTIHQFTTIGAFCMVGMSSVVAKDLRPFGKWLGVPARFRGVNEVGLSRNGFSEDVVREIVRAYEDGSERFPDAVEAHVAAFRARNAETHRPIVAID